MTQPFDAEQLAARIQVAARILSLQTEITALAGLLPICAHCKKLRDDKNYWPQVEFYMAQRPDARFSHGYGPDRFNQALREVADVIGTSAGTAI